MACRIFFLQTSDYTSGYPVKNFMGSNNHLIIFLTMAFVVFSPKTPQLIEALYIQVEEVILIDMCRQMEISSCYNVVFVL